MSTVGKDAEQILEVPAITMAVAERLGELVLEEYEPTALQRPTDLDMAPWVEKLLPSHGIKVYPADDADMPGMEGFTDPDDCTEDRQVVVIRESHWHSILERTSGANRAKATVLHELGHVLLHIPYLLKRRASTPPGPMALRRGSWGQIPAYKNAEWQAWAVAGAIAMPRRTLVMLPRLSVSAFAKIYGVSTDFARSHLKRLKMLP